MKLHSSAAVYIMPKKFKHTSFIFKKISKNYFQKIIYIYFFKRLFIFIFSKDTLIFNINIYFFNCNIFEAGSFSILSFSLCSSLSICNIFKLTNIFSDSVNFGRVMPSFISSI